MIIATNLSRSEAIDLRKKLKQEGRYANYQKKDDGYEVYELDLPRWKTYVQGRRR